MPAPISLLLKIRFLLLAMAVAPFLALAQTPKGFIVKENGTVAEGKTRALVIGISKYEHIDPLQYADRDARIFADYLQQTRFWGIEKEDITLLLNEKAKYGNLTVELQRVALLCKPGDNLLFYFSGHGDVETQTLFNRGYLLAADTYSSNYMANGLRVDDLKDIIVTLLNKEVKVLLITDACRSGNLAGGIKGAAFTASAISSMWKNEIKILSSQAGQLSQESGKWGEGQGVFSYYLVKGLKGEADMDKDSVITLSELDSYVGKNVSAETNYQQQPVFEGPNKYSTILVKMNTPLQKSLPVKTGNSLPFLKTYRLPDDSCTVYYRAMQKAIREERFDDEPKTSAAFFYQRLKHCSSDSNLLLDANAQLLSALVNKLQEIVNNSFIGKNLVTEARFDHGVRLAEQALLLNDLQLPYQRHWNNLRRYLFVLGKATWYEETKQKISPDRLIRVIDSAIREEPDAAYLLTAKAVVEMRNKNWKAAIGLLEQALAKSPNWLIPKYHLGICYSNTKSYAKALEYYDEVLRRDSTYRTFECTKCILGKMGEWAWEMKNYKKGTGYYLLSIDQFPDYWPPYEALYDYVMEKRDTATARELVQRFKRYDDTASMRLQRIRLEYDFFKTPLSGSLPAVLSLLKNKSDSADYYYTLGIMHKEEMNDEDSAIFFYQKAIELEPAEITYLQVLSTQFMESGDPEAAQQLLEEKLDAYTGEEKLQVKFVLGTIYLQTGRLKEAFALFREIKEAGFYTCSDLRAMKKTFDKLPEYGAYMKSCSDKKPAEQ